MFVHPSQVADIVQRHPDLGKARLVVDNPGSSDRMTLRCEVLFRNDAMARAVAVTIRDVTKLRGEVEFVAPGSLPNDGKVIEDARKYE